MTTEPNTHVVILATGKRVNWARPPKGTVMCRWSKKTTGGKEIRGSFRTIAHLDALNRRAVRRYGAGVEILQGPYNSTVAASAGTHDYDACTDVHIPGVGWWEQQRFFRANGAGAWYRHRPAFGNHIHMFTLPPARDKRVPVTRRFQKYGFRTGKYVDGGWSQYGRQVGSSQLEDYYEEAFGLSGQHTPGSDNTWFPKGKAGKDATIFDLGKYCRVRAAAEKRAAAA